MKKNSFNFGLLLVGTAITTAVCLVDALLESDGLIYFVAVIPVISLALITFLVIAAIRKRPQQLIWAVAMLLIYGLFSVGFLKNYFVIRNSARWYLWSRQYKAEVLNQPSPQGIELRHIDWDGWGFPGAGDTNVYLAFDPTDSLEAAAKNHSPAKVIGIPCTVPVVNRLEKQWYAVMFYTDESWGKPHTDCGMSD